MDMNVLVEMIKYISSYVITVLPSDFHYILTLYGHGSRKVLEYIEVCRRKNCVAAVNASDTTIITQPCDQGINRVLQGSGREQRNICLSQVTLKLDRQGLI